MSKASTVTATTVNQYDDQLSLGSEDAETAEEHSQSSATKEVI